MSRIERTASKGTRSILRRLRWSMMGFGLAMGAVFPIYADFFVVWKPGMFPFFAAGAVVAGIVVGLVNHSLMRILLLAPLRSVSKVAQSLREGDLRAGTGITSDDAIGRIAEDLDESIRELSGSIEALEESTRVVRSCMSSVSESRMVVSTSIDAISENASGTAKLADRELDAIDSASMGMVELSTAIEHASESVAHASEDLSGLASRSRNQLEDMSAAVDRLERLADRMDSFQASVARIRSSMSMLERIGKQTEVLSLNASIEATRAGGSGKGFAVVAEEIRGLARDSRDANSSIGREVDSIHTRLTEALQELRTLRGAMSEARDLATDVSESADRQESALVSCSAQMRRSAASVADQAKSVSCASDAIRSLVDVLHRLDTETSRSRDDLANMGTGLERLRHETDSLAAMASRFRT